MFVAGATVALLSVLVVEELFSVAVAVVAASFAASLFWPANAGAAINTPKATTTHHLRIFFLHEISVLQVP
jgi:hypothetical protein